MSSLSHRAGGSRRRGDGPEVATHGATAAVNLTGPRASRAIAALAEGQHGLVTRRQVLGAGISRHVLARRIGEGALRPVHRGVYQVGPVASARAAEMAAVLACGPATVVSHGSAGTVLELPVSPVEGRTGRGPAGREAGWRGGGRDGRSGRGGRGRAFSARPSSTGLPPVEVTLREGNRMRPGIVIHRTTTLRDDEVTAVERIPVTTAARTILDLAESLEPRVLERVVADALARRLATSDELQALLRRHGPVPGSRVLRALVGGAGRAELTRSEAEDRLLALVRRARLEAPEVNVRVAGFEVDFLWRACRLIVEVDGFAFHGSRAAFEKDRRRGAVLVAAGLRVVRVTWRQLVDEPEAVVARLAGALATSVRL